MMAIQDFKGGNPQHLEANLYRLAEILLVQRADSPQEAGAGIGPSG